MNRWYLDENDIDIYLKCTDDVRWNYNPKELVRILNNLETKLAESNESHHKNIVELTKMATEKDRKIEELKRQLIEKEKDLIIKCRTIGVLVEKSEKYTQDKISFALEQLEKVKESVLGIDKTEIKTLKNGFSTLYVDRPEVITKLDNQIKQLKERK